MNTANKIYIYILRSVSVEERSADSCPEEMFEWQEQYVTSERSERVRYLPEKNYRKLNNQKLSFSD